MLRTGDLRRKHVDEREEDFILRIMRDEQERTERVRAHRHADYGLTIFGTLTGAMMWFEIPTPLVLIPYTFLVLSGALWMATKPE